jgi:hypothetical protein
MLENLETTIDEFSDKFGPLRGRLSSRNVYDEDSQAVQSLVNTTAQIVGRAMEGGVLRKEDEIKYKNMLPQLTDTPAVAKRKLANVVKVIQEQRKIREQSFLRAGYSTGGGVDPTQEESFSNLAQ